MSKDKDLLARFGGNLAESMGAGRSARVATPGAAPTAAAASGRHDGVGRLRSAAEIEVGRIGPDPGQPRTEFDADALARLAASLETHGQLQPIAVRWSEAAGRYLIVAGERRWRAAQIAGRRTVAAVILEGEPDEGTILEMQLIENCVREDLLPVEQARAFRALMDRNGWTAARLAESLHLTEATVSRALALLKLPYTVQEAVESGELAPSVAYEVSKLDDPEAQAAVAARVVAEGLNRAEAVEVVKRAAPRAGKVKGRGAKPTPKRTTATLRTAAGRVTVENRRGVDDQVLIAALAEALELVRARVEGRGAAA